VTCQNSFTNGKRTEFNSNAVVNL